MTPIRDRLKASDATSFCAFPIVAGDIWMASWWRCVCKVKWRLLLLDIVGRSTSSMNYHTLHHLSHWVLHVSIPLCRLPIQGVSPSIRGKVAIWDVFLVAGILLQGPSWFFKEVHLNFSFVCVCVLADASVSKRTAWNLPPKILMKKNVIRGLQGKKSLVHLIVLLYTSASAQSQLWIGRLHTYICRHKQWWPSVMKCLCGVCRLWTKEPKILMNCKSNSMHSTSD